MSKVKRTLKIGDDIVEVSSDNLPDAAPNAKGAVKQGESIAKITDTTNVKTALTANAILSSLRNSGVIGNDKFVVQYMPNYTEDFDEDWFYDIYDENVYSAGDTATVKFVFRDEDMYPFRSGYKFKGWATTPDAVVPTYPYDESDPQTYTVTFVDNDITLYAVWEMIVCTLTYSLGEYGEGSVPAPQTEPEGFTVQVSFSPAPTVNDGSGRVFVGWSYEDGATSYPAADFRQDGTTSIYLYDDVTLYPVFAAQYTLTYALGNDAMGTVPSAQTAYNGETLSIDFNPSVTCISDNTKVFVGWSTTDESASVDYEADGTDSIYMSSNVTLYPVFGTESAGNSITIDNTDGEADVVIKDNTLEPIKTIYQGDTDTFNFNVDETYTIEHNGTMAEFDGTYQGTGYYQQNLNFEGQKIQSPSGGRTWSFYDGDSGTLTLSSK